MFRQLVAPMQLFSNFELKEQDNCLIPTKKQY